MKKASLVALGTIPGILFAYALLTGFLMKKVRPVPIVAMPEKRAQTCARTARQLTPA
jgi:hypothetical protein